MFSPCFRMVAEAAGREHPFSFLRPRREDLLQRSFVPRRYLLSGEAENLCVSEPARARAAGSTSSGGSITQVRTYCNSEFVRATWVCTKVNRDCTSFAIF